MHVDADRSDWLPQGQSPLLADRTTWRAGIGPSIMMRGVNASSQLGIYSDGVGMLQIVSTRVSLNGNLTEVRLQADLEQHARLRQLPLPPWPRRSVPR